MGEIGYYPAHIMVMSKTFENAITQYIKASGTPNFASEIVRKSSKGVGIKTRKLGENLYVGTCSNNFNQIYPITLSFLCYSLKPKSEYNHAYCPYNTAFTQIPSDSSTFQRTNQAPINITR